VKYRSHVAYIFTRREKKLGGDVSRFEVKKVDKETGNTDTFVFVVRPTGSPSSATASSTGRDVLASAYVFHPIVW
jgi:hypothetical protein